MQHLQNNTIIIGKEKKKKENNYSWQVNITQSHGVFSNKSIKPGRDSFVVAVSDLAGKPKVVCSHLRRPEPVLPPLTNP